VAPEGRKRRNFRLAKQFNFRGEMRREDDNQLWELLGQAQPPAVSPLFARNVLRRIREQPKTRVWVLGWLNLRSLIPASTVAVALVVAFFVVYSPSSPAPMAANDSDPVAKIDPQDYAVVADLDELVASDENALWDDNSSL
jgi:hypothetical protein